ncbi:hypothetical protein CY34DRAFT_814203 [Suillus luteus UH-Slu-Lm8-n1]|uniref:Uncharacterized protein n=1 Tax=Suillus luteus UH-Slu-Lm8-n1 TaxID=930992 RepID=A0A0D0AL17_9AGAM|nr:hypothetical protein CY34DRAFT_814203 [Suillus luteus UH-Slu-Lm8-n1]
MIRWHANGLRSNFQVPSPFFRTSRSTSSCTSLWPNPTQRFLLRVGTTLACISLVSEAVFFVGFSESVLSGPAVLPQPNRVPFFLSALGYS